MPSQALSRELIRATLWALLGGLVGSRFDMAWLGVSVVLAFRLVLHVRNLSALRAWLSSPKQVALPIVGGTWGEAFDGLLTLQKRNRKRKKKLWLYRSFPPGMMLRCICWMGDRSKGTSKVSRIIAGAAGAAAGDQRFHGTRSTRCPSWPSLLR